MEPGKTSFFQALGVPTKIARGTIEITTDLKLVEAGGKVGASEATLLNMLNISPFTYGMGITQVYDHGNTFPPSVLDITEEQLLGTLTQAITTIASLSLALNFPTLPSVIHSVFNGYKKVLAIAVETDYSWPAIEELKDRIANPDSYAAAAPAAGESAGGAGEEKTEEKAEEKEDEESEDDGGFGGLLFVIPSRPNLPLSRLTLFLAIKCNRRRTAMVFWGLPAWFGSGKGFTDLCPSQHISTAGKTSSWHLAIPAFPPNYRDMLRLLVTFNIGVSTPYEPQVSRFFPILQEQPVFHVEILASKIKNYKELFNPDL